MTSEVIPARPGVAARIVVEGVVDADEVREVERAVRDALVEGPGIEVDVRAVERWSAEAIRGLADCAQLGPGVEILMRGSGTSSSRVR